MGTFDSVYLNKIRLLEEENQQLKNILNEYFAPAFFGKSPEEIAQLRKPKNPFEKFESGPPMSPEERQKRRESATRLYREMRKRGDLPKNIEERPILNNPPEQAPYPSDDMESRRVQPGYGGADGPEGMKDQFGRSRDRANYGQTPLIRKGGFGRPLTPGMGGMYK